jgi:hypothetical protein
MLRGFGIGKKMVAGAIFFTAVMALAAGSSARKPPYPQSAIPDPSSRVPAERWQIEGQLSEACTCNVPCTCNFGMGPSPHAYCYAFYSYEIRKGQYGGAILAGLHFGAADLRSGRTVFIDEKADSLQREALVRIIARVILRAQPAEVEARVREVIPNIRYAAVSQQYDAGRNSLLVSGIGEFSAEYLRGIDKSQPIVVKNNATWRIEDTIKAKTLTYRLKIGNDVINVRNTNSNEGAFSYTSETDFGAPAAWNCSGGLQ